MVLTLHHLERWTLKFVSFLSGCLFCFFLQSEYHLGSVLAAALTGVLGSFLPDTKKMAGVHIHATVYMGAFVAMGSKVVDAGVLQIVLVSILGSSIYFFMTPYFKGFGGKLGLIAFISSLLGVGVRYWL